MSFKSKFVAISIALPVILFIYGLLSIQYDIVLNSLYTVLCIVALIIIHKKFSLLTIRTYYSVIIFILLSVFAGRSLGFYSLIPYWDKALHFLSGFIIAAIGKQIYTKLSGDTTNKILISLFVASFSIAAAGVWEIYEFIIDSVFGIESQNGSLNDTMWDMIAGTLSALISIIASLITKKEKRP